MYIDSLFLELDAAQEAKYGCHKQLRFLLAARADLFRLLRKLATLKDGVAQTSARLHC